MSNLIADEIRRIRLKLGLTQIEFCRFFNSQKPRNLKLTQAVLSGYELGRYMPRASKYRKIKSLDK